MIANHIHDALAQVRRLREVVLERRTFHGYSGKARVFGAVFALLGAVVMSRQAYPSTPTAHLVGWGSVLGLALLINYGALASWFFFSEEARRDAVRAMPALDAIPILGVGALFSLLMIQSANFDYLPGMWMCVYGLAHVPYRLSLPRSNYLLGLCYVICGALYLVLPWGLVLTNPWPMGTVFFAGELIGGVILHKSNHE